MITAQGLDVELERPAFAEATAGKPGDSAPRAPARSAGALEERSRGHRNHAARRTRHLGAVAVEPRTAGPHRHSAGAASIAIRSSRPSLCRSRAEPLQLTADQQHALRRSLVARCARRIPDGAAPWRHRQRQDGAVSSTRRPGPRAGEGRAAAGSGNRADARGRGRVPAHVRHRRRDSAQRTVGRRTARSVASHPQR